jgi:hypothetical protein
MWSGSCSKRGMRRGFAFLTFIGIMVLFLAVAGQEKPRPQSVLEAQRLVLPYSRRDAAPVHREIDTSASASNGRSPASAAVLDIEPVVPGSE